MDLSDSTYPSLSNVPPRPTVPAYTPYPPYQQHQPRYTQDPGFLFPPPPPPPSSSSSSSQFHNPVPPSGFTPSAVYHYTRNFVIRHPWISFGIAVLMATMLYLLVLHLRKGESVRDLLTRHGLALYRRSTRKAGVESLRNAGASGSNLDEDSDDDDESSDDDSDDEVENSKVNSDSDSDSDDDSSSDDD